MAKQYLIELILRMVKKGEGAKDISKAFGNIEDQAKKAGKQLDVFGSFLRTSAAIAVPLTTALYTLKKAMDLGREGAAIQQTGESFEYLLTKVGASADLLDQLRTASRGTISDMSLMTSTSTLLAGAQGELATQLAQATPELLEIAKAANKLNPSLGDTTFLYNSLAVGVKRASPLILDNLGLTIKIGAANEAWAKTLGKTVEQLTAEEQKQALLNETLRAGRVLIEQAGGSTEAATDAFDQFNATLQNTIDAAKRDFAPAVAAVVSAINDLIDSQNLDDMRAFERQIYKNADSYQEYVKAVLDAMVADGQMSQSEADALQVHYATGKGLIALGKEFEGNIPLAHHFTEAIGLLSRAEYDAINAAEELADAYGTSETRFLEAERAALRYKLAEEEVAEAAEDQRKAFEYTDEELKKVKEDLFLTGGELDSLADKTGLTREELMRLNSEFGMGEDAILDYVDKIREAQRAYEGLISTLAGGITDIRDIGEAEKDSAKEYEDALRDLQQKSKDVYKGLKLDFEASLPDPTTVRDRMGMQEDAWDEWGLRFQDIIENGMASPFAAMLEDMGLAKPPDIGIKEWAEQLKEGFYKGDLAGLINEDAQAWQEHAATMKAAQADATAAYNNEVAQRKAAIAEETAALKAARDEQLAAEKEARQQAVLELSLQIAEQTNQLQQWSQQKFGPDFSGVADTAQEVLGLIDAGMITIDGDLANLIGNTAAGIQNALDMTGQAAEDNKTKLDEILSPEWAAEQQEKLQTALDLQAALPPEDVEALKSTVQTGITEAVPEDPFANLLLGFQTTTTTMQTDLDTLGIGFETMFTNITTGGDTSASSLAATYETALSSMADGTESAAGEMGDALGGIADDLSGVVDMMGRAKAGALAVKEATNKWRREVRALIGLYYKLAQAMKEAGALDESPPRAELAALAIADAYDELAHTIGTALGNAVSSAAKDFAELVKAGKSVEAIGTFFGKLVEEDLSDAEKEINSLTYQIRRLDRALAQPETLTQDELNRKLAERAMLMEQLAALQEQQTRQSELLLQLEEKRKQLAVLEQQVKLLDLLAERGIDAREILAGVTLGAGADPEQIAAAMTRALEVIIQQAQERLEQQMQPPPPPGPDPADERRRKRERRERLEERRRRKENLQHGGQFEILGPGTTDSIPVRFWATPGETVTVTPRGEMPPPVPGSREAQGQMMQTGHMFNFSLAPTIYSRMDEAEFQQRVEMAVRRALQG